jgi:hypothetical protein
VLYVLVATDCAYTVDLFMTRVAAERALAKVVADEPDFATMMAVVLLGDLPPFPLSEN